MRFSPSGLRLFEQCQGAFGLKYVDKMKENDNYYAKVGRDVHAMIEAKLKGIALEPQISPNQEAFDLYQNFEQVFLPDCDPQTVLIQEELVETQLGEHTLGFKMDRLEEVGGFLTVKDWKTGFKMLTVDEMKKDLQVRAYCVAALKLFPKYDDVVFVICNVRHRLSQYLEVTRKEVEIWENSLRSLMVLVGARMKAAEAKNSKAFPFYPGAPCLNCGYLGACKAGKTALKAFKGPKNVKGATSIAQKLELLGAHYEKAKKALKEWVGGHGSVTVNGATWGYFGSQGIAIDEGIVPDELKPELEAYKVLDQKKTSKIWENTALLEKLKVAGALRPTSRQEFTSKKTIEEE